MWEKDDTVDGCEIPHQLKNDPYRLKIKMDSTKSVQGRNV